MCANHRRAAVEQSAWRLRQLKALLPTPQSQQQTMGFMEQHPLIRPLSVYQQLLPNDCFAAEEAAIPNLNTTAEPPII